MNPRVGTVTRVGHALVRSGVGSRSKVLLVSGRHASASPDRRVHEIGRSASAPKPLPICLGARRSSLFERWCSPGTSTVMPDERSCSNYYRTPTGYAVGVNHRACMHVSASGVVC